METILEDRSASAVPALTSFFPGRTVLACLLGLWSVAVCATGQAPPPSPTNPQTISVDASISSPPPEPATFTPGASLSPGNHQLGLNQRYLTLDNHPWLPVMGEFHFSRVPEAQWEPEILKMKASGVQIIATYIFWIHHEETEGQWNWTGQRNLHHFIELCQKHGLYVYARIGPWAHGEARNGGLPDWLLKQGPTRRNDPAYLKHVNEFYAQIATQLHGQLWKDGGPVIGVQLENEYSQRGIGAGEQHILELKRLALAQGIDVPLYSVTGWDRAAVPHGAVLPVYGGYPDAPWDASLQPLPPNEVYLFRFGSRVAGNMGAIGSQAQKVDTTPIPADTPFITAEMGGGVEDTYHRRPVLTADDVAAMFPVMLGSGVNLYGTYMYHGGINPAGARTTLQESQATGYPSDLPVASYDFQAPLSSYGEERPLLRKLKLVNYFLNSFGDILAPMTPHAPQIRPANPADLTVPRLAVRSSGESGFVFLNNHIRGVTMPPRNHFQVRVELPGGSLTVPSRPVDIPSDSYFIWPFHLDLNGVQLRFSTAQLFTRLQGDGTPIFIFFCIPNIRCDLSFAPSPGLAIDAGGLDVKRSPEEWLVSKITGGTNRWITLTKSGHLSAKILVLSQQQAEDAWTASFDGNPHLLLTNASFYTDDRQITLESIGDPQFHFQVIPSLPSTPTSSPSLHAIKKSPTLTQFQTTVPTTTPALLIKQVKTADEVAPARLGPPPHGRKVGLAQSPEETGIAAAAQWRLALTLPTHHPNVSTIFLRIRYTGDLAQLKSGDRLLDDNFFNGQTWSVALPFNAQSRAPADLSLNILPFNSNSAIFLEPTVRHALPATGQILQLRSVVAIPQYQLQIETGSKPRQQQ